MKRVISLICTLTLLFSLSACKSVPSDTISEVLTSESAVSTELTVTVGEQNETQTEPTKKKEKPTETTSEITESVTEPSKENTTALSESTTKHKTQKDKDKTTQKKKPETQSTTKRNAATEQTTIKKSESVKTTAPTLSVPQTTNQTVSEKTDVCYVTIVCDTINANYDKLKDSKKDFVPSDGIILKDVQVEMGDGESAFDIIKKACTTNVCKAKCKYCQKSGIQLEYTYNPGFGTYYIEGIHQIYEKDCGMQSGWMYSVNGVFPNVGASSYKVTDGDRIVFAYTCNMGEDVGNAY